MTRIIAGVARGRRLRVPPGGRTRPTADRAREGLFSAIEARVVDLGNVRFCDLYAGSGAVGLEALSRGVAAVTFVESARPALTVLRDNIATVGLPGATVVAGRLPTVLADAPAQPFHVLFADPPYSTAATEVVQVLELAAAGWLADGALVVLERSSRDAELLWPSWWEPLASRRYGEATFWYGRARIGGGPLRPPV